MRHSVPLFIGFLAAAVLPAQVQAQAKRAHAETPQKPVSEPSGPVAAAHIDYQLYSHGLRIGRVEAGLQMQAARYRIEVAFRTFGLIGFLFRGHQLDTAEGRIGGALPEPQRFFGEGFWRGTPRRILIDYIDRQPVVRDIAPPNDGEREPVPPSLQTNTMDTLSAMVLLINRVASTGRCDAGVDTFDGRRAVRFNARTTGETELEPTGRSTFQGRALRCDFEGKLLAGYRLEDSASERGKSRHGAAWFAQVVPGAPLLPVRIEFETPLFGDATMYLVSAGPGGTRDPPEE
jgi:hypothetical protein